MTPAERLESTLRAARPALAAFVTAGYPDRTGFPDLLRSVARAADVVEIGVPFSDPMADGVTIQRASRAALDAGVTLEWILGTLAADAERPKTPLVLMSYLNPLLQFGFERLAAAARAAGVCGAIVPDLPLEEAAPLRAAFDAHGLALVQLVTPVTPAERLARAVAASRGFVYAVAVVGITGGNAALGPAAAAYLDRVRAISPVPVLAGFGVREAAHVRAVAAHADGAIVGSALIEALERGDDPERFLESLLAGTGREKTA